MRIKQRISNILKMSETVDDVETRIKLLRQNFIAAYPRIQDKPEMNLMFEQLLLLYRDSYRIHDEADNVELDERQRDIKRKTFLNFIHEIGSILVKMGLTYCSQSYIPSDERKTSDPKAVRGIQNQIDKLRERVAKELPLPPQESEPLQAPNSEAS
jgi:hypothetical protein